MFSIFVNERFHYQPN
ncbi:MULTISPECIES: ErmCL family antibiotic resistance leader peptide [Streptococcus]